MAALAGGDVRFTPAAIAASAAVLLAAALVPAFGSLYVVEVGTTMLLYVILCLGLNVVVGYAGLLDLGYAAFFAVGAYTTGILTTRFGLNFWLILPAGILFACLAGVVIGTPTLRLRSDYLAIVTLGFGEIVRLIARNLDITGGASGLVGIDRPWLFGWHLSRVQDFYYVFLGAVLLTVFVCVSIEHSRIGRAWRYVRYDEDAAAGIGIDRVAVKLYAYMTGAAIASVAGTLYAAKMTAISPESFTFTQSTLILLGFFGIGKHAASLAGSLSYGDQRRVEWARALASSPDLVLLDEPAAGLNHNEKAGLVELIRRVRDDTGVTILLIEHDMGLVMEVSEKVTVLDYGQKIAEGPPAAVQSDPAVIEAYLGTEE